jgi:phage tail sheath protein FI
MAQMKTPGVYIVEKDAFGNGVVEVATAVPAFIGFTERAENGGKSLLNKPMRITSIGEYNQFFGGSPKYQFDLVAAGAAPEGGDEGGDASAEPDFIVKDNGYNLSGSGENYRLYNAMRLFYQNGGGPCYIVSVGSWNHT